MYWEKDVTLILRTMELSAPSYLRLNNLLNNRSYCSIPHNRQNSHMPTEIIWPHTHTNREREGGGEREGENLGLEMQSRYWDIFVFFKQTSDSNVSEWWLQRESLVLTWIFQSPAMMLTSNSSCLCNVGTSEWRTNIWGSILWSCCPNRIAGPPNYLTSWIPILICGTKKVVVPLSQCCCKD